VNDHHVIGSETQEIDNGGVIADAGRKSGQKHARIMSAEGQEIVRPGNSIVGWETAGSSMQTVGNARAPIP
jgi:hypothetical protein